MGKCTAADNLSGRGQVGTVSDKLLSLSLSVELIELSSLPLFSILIQLELVVRISHPDFFCHLSIE